MPRTRLSVFLALLALVAQGCIIGGRSQVIGRAQDGARESHGAGIQIPR